MNFSQFLDIQSWWEVPSIAYFCSLFRTAFNLLDFDIEELEEALLTDGSEHSGKSLLTELIVRLLKGSLGYNDISAFNYQMYLRRLFRKKCQNTGRYNPFNTDIDFQFLPLRTKVEILYALCDFRLDAEDVFDLFKNLEAESLRVEPLGWDDNDSAYWYFYGTRLYREDIKKSGKSKRKKSNRRRSWFYGDDYLQDNNTERVWQVVCFTEEDWTNLTEKFRQATSKAEKELYRSLSINFLPEIPRLFQEKERLQRKRLLEVAPRRTSSRVLQKSKQRDEEYKASVHDATEETTKDQQDVAREVRAKRRHLLRLTRPERQWRAAGQGSSGRSRPAGPGSSSVAQRRTKSTSSESDSSESEKEERVEAMPQKSTKTSKGKAKRTKSCVRKREPPPPPPPVRTGRKTNNSLASATGQIVIPDNDEPVNSTRRKIKTSQIFSQTEEDMQTDMYKVLEQLAHHEEAWPFLDPVEEEYAPNYYAVIRRPMDLHTMEYRLDHGFYTDFTMFKADFKLIVNNCRLYNGQDNEYTRMVDNLQIAFERLTEKYIHRPSSSDEEIAVEYQIPTPSRKHKLKHTDSPPRQKGKKRKIETVVSGDLAKMKKSERDRHKKERQDSKRSNTEEEEGDQKPDKESEEKAELEVEPDGMEEQQKVQEKAKGRKLLTPEPEPMLEDLPETEEKKSKESHKHKDGKGKKKRKGHHRKHSKNHKKEHKSGKRKHGKKRGKKDAEGKREKKKKKKSKHHEEVPEPPVEELKRSMSHESLESSNRSRSASPLPSIHTPTPSPEPIEQPPKSEPEPSDVLSDPEFLKDKYDKIKERRRTAAKDAWESLIEYKQKAVIDKQKHNIDIPHKDKNPKLKETIEKLKAKNEKINYDNLYTTGRRCLRRSKPTHTKTSKDFHDNTSEEDEEEKEPEEDEEEEVVVKKKKRRGSKKVKKSSAKNASASVALEQAVKDISKWLDDAPKGSVLSSPSDSPAQTISTEEFDGSRLDDELSQGERSLLSRRDASRKRHSSRDNRVVKRREIQRTIERLQPGKSKGNLLTNIGNKNVEKTEEVAPLGPSNKVRDSSREESSPKLSLGSVLPTVDFTIGNDHKFNDKDEQKTKIHKESPKLTEVNKEVKEVQTSTEELPDVQITSPNKKDAEVETEPINVVKPSQEKATPNLSAWFKAFGAPKSTPSAVHKKKAEEEIVEKCTESVTSRNVKQISPKPGSKSDSLNDPGTPNADGGDSPLTNVNTTRHRRTSTGSSVSEKSSFSQDLDSPRHQMSHNSPLLRSPASPRTEDFQKITYPIINGTVRAGFYQDTTSIKSPDKNCSPREGPHSPYSPYSQYVYASNNATGSSTPNYFIDHNKSPRPAYGQNAPYYDSSKANLCKPRAHEDYAGQDAYQQIPYNGPYAQPVASLPPPPPPPPAAPPPPPPQLVPDPKTALFPVKKRTYNEPDVSTPPKNSVDTKDSPVSPVNNEFAKPMSHPPLPPLSVDDIALALSEKSELAKMNSLREKGNLDYSDSDNPENLVTDHLHDGKNETKEAEVTKVTGKKDNIDMVNMGYLNTVEAHEIDYLARDVSKSSQYMRKGYEIEAVAINLGISNSQLQKTMSKANINNTPNMTPAHAHESTIPRAAIHTDLGVNQNLAHVHHNQYDSLPGTQNISNFSLNDIELANKKLYSCNTATAATAIDYGNWKMSNPMRKQDMLPSDYSTSYSTTNEEKKAEVSSANSTPINYNKTMHNQQYANYNNLPRASLPRSQEIQQNLPAELRIPNPRGLLKADSVVSTATISDSDAMNKSMDTHTKSQKSEKHSMCSIPYKSSYTTLSSLPIDTLRNLPNYPRMLDRYRENERYLPSFPGGASLYHDKAYQMAELFNKTMASEAHQPSTSIGYSQPAVSVSKESTVYKTPSSSAGGHPEPKPKNKRKRTVDPKTVVGQNYHPPTCSSDMLTAVKPGMMPSSAFNVGTGMNMAALGGMYGDNSGYALVDDLRTSTNQLMAANYMAAAAEKLAKPAHQNSTHSGSFSFIGPQVRAGYPFVGADASSPLYQQYLQRYQEELQRQTGAQIMGLYAPPYAPQLTTRQPYDSINRPTWL